MEWRDRMAGYDDLSEDHKQRVNEMMERSKGRIEGRELCADFTNGMIVVQIGKPNVDKIAEMLLEIS